MKRYLSILICLSLYLLPALAQEVAKGYVYEDVNGNGRKERREKGIAGVAVSDGANIVLTDETGRYELPVDDHCVIFVIKPKGYISPVNELNQPQCWYIHKPAGSPQLKYEGSKPTGPLPESLDFPMEKYEDAVDFDFYAFGDSQPYSLKNVEYFRKEIVEEARKREGISFGITLGDVVGDHLDLHPHYLDAIKDMGIPWYNVIGNHDRNYDGKVEEYANETFEKNFGPSTYAFRYGDTHFLLLDDIFMHLAPKSSPYKGGFSESQFKFMENYAKLIDKNELLVICYHVPISYKENQFLDEHRRRFFNIFSGHNVLGLSAHTHIQMQFFYGEDLGWHGEKPYHEYNVGTSNGDWYSGKIGEDGLPDATMRDGTPQGYAIIHVSGNEYTFDYKVAGQPDDYAMRIYSPKTILHRQGGKYPIYVNFFIGCPDDVVEYRIDNGSWKKMKRVTDEADPTFLSLVREWDTAEAPLKGKRPDSTPAMCTHLWKALLDSKLEPGVHQVEIRAKDMFGRTHKGVHSYTVAAPVPSSQDPVTTIEVGPWVTNVGENGFNVLWTSSCRDLSWVEVAPDDGTPFDSVERPRFYQVISGRRVTDTFHDVRVEGLEPVTKYRYRIMSKAIVNDDSAYHTDFGPLKQMPVEGESAVRTLDREADNCRFVMLNDMHAIDEKYMTLLDGNTSEDMDFLLLCGDMMSYINNIGDMLDHVYAPVPQIVSSIPTFYTRGNHETRGRQAYLFQKYNPTSTGDTYFMLRHGPVAVVVLDAGEDKPDTNKEYSGTVDFELFRQQQLEWLKEAVKDPLFVGAPVKVAVMHIPAFNSKDSWYGEKRANEMLVPVLNEAGVDIMLSGHYHRHVYAEKGKYGNDFPILANDNNSRLEVDASEKGCTVRVYDLSGNLTHIYDVEK